MIRRYSVHKKFTDGLLCGLSHTSEFNHDDASPVPMWTVGQHVVPFMSSPFTVVSVTEVALKVHPELS